MEITCVVDAHNLVGESPLWHPEHNSIYWTDINGFRIHRYALRDGEVTSWQFSEPVCALSLTTRPDQILVALASRLIVWSPTSDSRIDFAHPEPDWPLNRLNDGATDPNGVYWVGSMRNNVAPDGSELEASGNTGSLYRITPAGEVTVWDKGFGITNTVVWSPDRKTFYCGDSLANCIYAYDYNAADSSIGNRREFIAGVKPGLPDGSAIDSEGYLWNCRFYGGCILRFSPQGKLDFTLEMPVSNLTHCAFGGPDLRTLYITSASVAAPEGEPHAGGLFACEVDVPGLALSRFALR